MIFEEIKENRLQASSVKEVMQKHHVLFVHGFALGFHPVQNSLLNKNVSAGDKLRLILSMNPTLSASSLKPNDNGLNLWSPLGVVLSDGSINAAFSNDGATKAESLTTRASASQPVPIEDAILRRGVGYGITGAQYNEFSISNPKVGALYISVDYQNKERLRKLVSDISDLVAVSEQLKIPIFIIYEGRLYRKKEGDIAFSDIQSLLNLSLVDEELNSNNWSEIQINEVVNLSTSLPSRRREEIAEDLLGKHIFNLQQLEKKLPFINYVMAYNQGRETAFVLMAGQSRFEEWVLKQPRFNKINIQDEFLQQVLPDSDNLRLIGRFFIGDMENTYIYVEGVVYRFSVNHADGSMYLDELRVQDYTRGGINVGFAKDKITQGISSVSEYISAVKQRIDDVRNSDMLTETKEDLIKRLKFYLYGMIEQTRLCDYLLQDIDLEDLGELQALLGKRMKDDGSIQLDEKSLL